MTYQRQPPAVLVELGGIEMPPSRDRRDQGLTSTRTSIGTSGARMQHFCTLA
jgi:hypothetical protein